MHGKASKKILLGVSLGLLSALVVVFVTKLLLPTIFDNFEAKTLDWRYRSKVQREWTLRQGEPIEDIIIVAVDDRSLQKLGRYDQWPREYHARLIDFISQSGAAAIGFDILFMERDANPTMDSLMVQGTRRAGNVHYAMAFSAAEPDAFLYAMEQAPPGFHSERFSYRLSDAVGSRLPTVDRFDGKLIELYNSAAGIGFANFTPDDDGIIRRMPLFVTFAGRQYPSLAFSIVSHLFALRAEDIHVELGKQISFKVDVGGELKTVTIPIDRRGWMFINYFGPYQTFRYVSYYDVLERRLPPEMFQDRIVLVGASAAGLSDLRPVPVQAEPLPGVEVHANLIYDILTQNFLRKWPLWTDVVLLFLLTVAVGLAAIFLRLPFSMPVTVVLAVMLVFATQWTFVHHSLWIEEVRPLLGLGLTYLSVTVYRYIDEERDKRKIKGMFQHYISATVVNELLKNPSMLKLGGERKVATAFFSDIKNFTTVSEKLTPEELVSVLNEYLSAMTDVVLKYEGYLDKYEGDAIVSIFGIPVPQADHAARACYAALEMQAELVKLRKAWRAQNRPLFETRIGINSGPMIAGNIGSKDRFDYTAIGDSVNLASRLEGANKMYGTSIMISEDTYEQVKDLFIARELDFIRVKGKMKPVRVYELLTHRSDGLPLETIEALEIFAEGLEQYRKQRWTAAIDLFEKVLAKKPGDGPATEFIRRCQIFMEHPRPADWDGVFEMRSK